MEYSFGELGQCEYVRVKGASDGVKLDGFCTVKQTYFDSEVTDRFRVKSELKRTDDYVWYLIDNHVRVIDKTPLIKAENEKLAALIDYLAMMTDVDIPQEGIE